MALTLPPHRPGRVHLTAQAVASTAPSAKLIVQQHVVPHVDTKLSRQHNVSWRQNMPACSLHSSSRTVMTIVCPLVLLSMAAGPGDRLGQPGTCQNWALTQHTYESESEPSFDTCRADHQCNWMPTKGMESIRDPYIVTNQQPHHNVARHKSTATQAQAPPLCGEDTHEGSQSIDSMDIDVINGCDKRMLQQRAGEHLPTLYT